MTILALSGQGVKTNGEEPALPRKWCIELELSWDADAVRTAATGLRVCANPKISDGSHAEGSD